MVLRHGELNFPVKRNLTQQVAQAPAPNEVGRRPGLFLGN